MISSETAFWCSWLTIFTRFIIVSWKAKSKLKTQVIRSILTYRERKWYWGDRWLSCMQKIHTIHRSQLNSMIINNEISCRMRRRNHLKNPTINRSDNIVKPIFFADLLKASMMNIWEFSRHPEPFKNRESGLTAIRDDLKMNERKWEETDTREAQSEKSSNTSRTKPGTRTYRSPRESCNVGNEEGVYHQVSMQLLLFSLLQPC